MKHLWSIIYWTPNSHKNLPINFCVILPTNINGSVNSTTANASRGNNQWKGMSSNVTRWLNCDCLYGGTLSCSTAQMCTSVMWHLFWATGATVEWGQMAHCQWLLESLASGLHDSQFIIVTLGHCRFSNNSITLILKHHHAALTMNYCHKSSALPGWPTVDQT